MVEAKGFFAKVSGGTDSIDLDASCLAFDGAGNLVETVWFQKLISSDGSIRHSGDNLTGEGDGDDETISIAQTGRASGRDRGAVGCDFRGRRLMIKRTKQSHNHK